MKYKLDFSLLPGDDDFARRSMVIGLPKELHARLALLPQTLERAESTVMFSSHSIKQSETWRAAAFLRAALADYCALEEVHKVDRPEAAPFKITNSQNPLLHLLELLRHQNIHVKTIAVKAHAISGKSGVTNPK
jgi:hypothetical protein